MHAGVAFGRKSKHRQRAKETRESLIHQKGCQCARCHATVAMDQWDFHHTNPNTKAFGISQKVIEGIFNNNGFTQGLKIIEAEAAKTWLMCRKCHQIIHKTKKKFFFDKAYWPFLKNSVGQESQRLFLQRQHDSAKKLSRVA